MQNFANRVVPVNQLADRVWGDAQAPGDPRGALRTYVSALRQALASENGVAFVRQSPGYKAVLDEQCVDLHRFRHRLSQARAAGDDDQAATLMQEALGLWRGEPFTGLDAALRRVLTWYLHTADAADRVLVPARRRVQLGPQAEGGSLAFRGYQQALAWCDVTGSLAAGPAWRPPGAPMTPMAKPGR